MKAPRIVGIMLRVIPHTSSKFYHYPYRSVNPPPDHSYG
jgi:hypothetical protein